MYEVVKTNIQWRSTNHPSWYLRAICLYYHQLYFWNYSSIMILYVLYGLKMLLTDKSIKWRCMSERSSEYKHFERITIHHEI